MKAVVILGVLLILLGIAILTHQWVTYTSSSYPHGFESAEWLVK
jgi:hypothetical protein